MDWFRRKEDGGDDLMILSEGKNQFKDNRFSFWEWSAPILQTGEEVIRRFHQLTLEGRVVKDIIALGMG